MLDITINNKVYTNSYIIRAVLFYAHLENHPEVQESDEHRGMPVCKICGQSAEEIKLRAK